MLTEPLVHTTPGKAREVTCPECGHTWKSRGKGKYFRCPACYERETGKKIGEHFIKTHGLKELREQRKKESSQPQPKQQPEKKVSLFKRILETEIL